MTVRKRQRAAENHATKNRRISGASRSAHARAHYQNGVVDKPPLEKMAPNDDAELVVNLEGRAGETYGVRIRSRVVFKVVE